MSVVTQSTVVQDEEHEEEAQVLMTLEESLDGLFEIFLASVVETDGQASIKDIFFNGVLSSMIMLKESLEVDNSLESITSTLNDLEEVLRFKHTEGEIELGHLLNSSDDSEDEDLEEDEDFDMEDFDDGYSEDDDENGEYVEVDDEDEDK